MKIPNDSVSGAFSKMLAKVGLPANVRVTYCDVGLFSRTVRLELELGMTAQNLAKALRLAGA